MLKGKRGEEMKLAEMFPEGGRGVIATANAVGKVNMAVYAKPYVVDEETVVWGMAEGRTWHNLTENPQAAYIYMAPGGAFRGWRLTLELKEIRDEGEMLDLIRANTIEMVSPHAGVAVKHVGYFKVVEVRDLI